MKRNNDYKRKFRKKSDEKEESIISKRNQNETVELNNHSMKKKTTYGKERKIYEEPTRDGQILHLQLIAINTKMRVLKETNENLLKI